MGAAPLGAAPMVAAPMGAAPVVATGVASGGVAGGIQTITAYVPPHLLHSLPFFSCFPLALTLFLTSF